MVDVDFKLAEVDGQKRVSNAARRRVPGQQPVRVATRARSLYFLTPDRQTLVPDPVFLPVNLPPGQVATQLVQELLKGPTSRFGNGVVSAAPPGTQVNVSVPVELSTATVALSDAAGCSAPSSASSSRPRSSGRCGTSAPGSGSPSAGHR